MSNWEEKYLSEVVDIRVSNVDKKLYPNKTLVKLCNYMDAYSNDYISNTISYSIGSADANEIQRFGLRINDVIITKDSETPEDIAVSSVVIEELENVVCGYHLAILRPDKDKLDGTFLMLRLKSNDLKSYFLSVANGSTRFGLTIGNILNAKITFPSLSTQIKIAIILSTADAIIEKTQATIAKYKAIKQGMLQDLFTRGILTKDIKYKDKNGTWVERGRNQLRPSYQDAPELYKESKLGWIPREWEDNQLSSFVEVINGGTPSTQIKEYWNGEIPWLSVDDFNNGERFVSTAYKKITQEGLKNSSTNILMPDMVIISARGTVGVISQLKIPMAFNQSCYGLNSINTNLQNDYLYYFLIYYKQYFGFTTYGSVFGTITRNYFDTMYIPMNLNSDEQKIIVGRLGIIDKKLQTEQDFLHKQQQIKAGLMNDLLSGRKKVSIKEKEIA